MLWWVGFSPSGSDQNKKRPADMTSAPSFAKVRFWVDELQANEPGCTVFIAGTKSLSSLLSPLPRFSHVLSSSSPPPPVDLIKEGAKARAVSSDEVKAFAQELRIDPTHIYETSAKTGEGLQELFDRVSTMYDSGTVPPPKTGVIHVTSTQRRSSSCCAGGQRQ